LRFGRGASRSAMDSIKSLRGIDGIDVKSDGPMAMVPDVLLDWN
jgi:hypothetical protein